MYYNELKSEISENVFDKYEKIVFERRVFDKKKHLKSISVDTYRYDNYKNIGLVSSRFQKWQYDKFLCDSGKEVYDEISLKDIVKIINGHINELPLYPINDKDVYASLKVIGYGVPDDTMQGRKTKISRKCSGVKYLENSVRNMF